jgi:hypothetical protein
MSQLVELANLADSYKQQYEAGQLSADDYKELINDLGIAEAIQNTASDLEEDIMAQQVLNACITLASAIY